jgi:FKBP-type peptidyl-prolyl cis-trans isomerase
MRFWIAAATAAALTLSAAPALAASSALSIEANQAYLAANAKKPGVQTMRDGLQYRILKSGFGVKPVDGDIVYVNYTLSLINGQQLQATEPDFPAQFPVSDLIPGWREALKTMRAGDHWQLFVPAELGYGPRGTADGSVPPNQTLVFDIELLRVVTPPPKAKKKDDDDQGGGQPQ